MKSFMYDHQPFPAVSNQLYRTLSSAFDQSESANLMSSDEVNRDEGHYLNDNSLKHLPLALNMTFMATMYFVVTSCAKYTPPSLPRPNCAPISKSLVDHSLKFRVCLECDENCDKYLQNCHATTTGDTSKYILIILITNCEKQGNSKKEKK
uniref:Uncharacterized protein n=1 Tax=Glossina pallidipes TaxID=7398 RepID=A0A1A9ZIF0_GLOPL